MRQHTRQSIYDLIQASWEPDTADKVLDALRPFDDKPITTRLLDKLPGGKEVWCLRREYGMTHLVNRAYSQGDFHNDISLLLCHTEASVSLDLKQVQELNSYYFSARYARNHARMEAMNTRETLDNIARTMNDIERAIENLTTADNAFNALTEYETNLNPVRYELMSACGLSDAKEQNLINPAYKNRTPEPVNVD